MRELLVVDEEVIEEAERVRLPLALLALATCTSLAVK
jgi:hypothetical protein